MSHLWNEEQAAFKDAADRFARERLAPEYQQREKTGRLDRDLLREMGALGLLGVDVPEQYGGLGLDGVTAGIVVEAVAYGDFNVSYVPLMNSLMGQIVAHNAPGEIAKEWLPRMVAGEALVGLGLTEPRGGSDASHLALRAERDGNGYRLHGEKTSITYADQGDAMVVFARTDPSTAGAGGVSAFFVPLDQPEITRTRFDDIGARIIGRGSVFFDGLRVPGSHRLGDEGRGFTQVMRGFDYSRALIALQCAAAAQASLDEAWAYSVEREAFGAPLARYQGVSFPLAEGETMVAAVRALAYETLARRDRGRPHTAEAAMVKWLGPKTAVEVIHQCLLTHGHYGYTTDLPHQQRLRDVMGLEIGDGTAQIMKLVIAREKVGRVALQYA